MSKYKVVLTEKFNRQLKGIDKTYRPAILRAVYFLGENCLSGKALTGKLKGYFSYRVGVYRIIYQIFHRNCIVLILTVSHRKDIYRSA